MTVYPGSTSADVQTVLSTISPSTKASIIKALTASGLLNDSTGVGIAVVNSVGDSYTVDTNTTQALVLTGNAVTQINSNGPILVAASQGTNYLDISHADRGADHRATVIGGSGNDTIVGNSARASLVGGSGAESIYSGGGRDTLVGGSGSNTLVAGGRSVVDTGSGSAVVNAGQSAASHDTIRAGSGSSTVKLTAGDNTVRAPTGGGKATITAGSGADTIFGPVANQGSATINGGAKTTLQLSTGSVKFNLSKGDSDTIFGGAGSGFVNLNKSTQDIASTTASTNANGEKQVTFNFSSGGSITAVGTVNLTFTDTRKH
jgi:hypothetical protein